MPVKLATDNRPIRSVTDQRLDFDEPAPLRKAYLIASSYRSGSTYLCWELWKTGVLGAPCEYLNPAQQLRVLMKRFNVFSPADYIASLLVRRTSRNGIFGMKEHFHHFEAFMKGYPALLEVLSPVTYIYINRRDRVAQAVSMAKALQTNAWSSRSQEGSPRLLQYDRQLIANCLEEVQVQDAAWLQWFEAQRVTPYPLTYEDLTADAPSVVQSVLKLLGVENDEREQVRVPPAEKQGDETNQEWIERFNRETRAGGGHGNADSAGDAGASIADGASTPATTGDHFFRRYDRLIKSLPESTKSATGFVDAIRLRRRYDAIISQNRELFRNARVLDVMSSHGFWSLAALDAGAAHVVAVETSRGPVDTAEKNFNEYGIKPESYKLVRSEIFAALRRFEPGQFDVILCKGFFERCYAPRFFHHLARLRPKHVVLDTAIMPGSGPLACFTIVTGRGRGTVTSLPSHDLIAFLCESQFRWRLIDWQALGITDWTGVQDYARDKRRTYLLDWLE